MFQGDVSLGPPIYSYCMHFDSRQLSWLCMDPVLALAPKVLRATLVGLYLWVSKTSCPDCHCTPNIVCGAERHISSSVSQPFSLFREWGGSFCCWAVGAATVFIFQDVLGVWWSCWQTSDRSAIQIASARRDGRRFAR